MKDKIRKLRRQNSTKSLMTEFGLQSDLTRRDSVLSLKSLGKELLTNIKSKNPFESDENYEEDDSFEENWLKMKSKKFGRRLSTLFDKKGDNSDNNSDIRRHSLSTTSLLNSQKISQTQKPEFCFPEELYATDENNEEAQGNPRSVMRKDLTICWLDQSQRIKKIDLKDKKEENMDIVTRLHSQVYTRHLLRKILSELDMDDVKNLVNVCISWRNIATYELNKNIIKR